MSKIAKWKSAATRNKIAWKRLRTGKAVRKFGKALLYNNANFAYRIKRTATGTTSQYYFVSNASATGPVFKAWSFSLDQVPNYTEFTNLFDSYKIDKIVMRFMPVHAQNISMTQNQSGATATISHPRVYTVLDYDDDSVPTSVGELTQYSGCKVRLAGKQFKLIFRPKVAMQVYRSAVTTAYANPDKQVKLDCAYADVPHFGVKLAMTDSGTAGYFGYDLNIDYYCSFYGIR